MPTPTATMAAEAQRGLDWRKEYNRGGTAVGVARARDIANRKDLSDETVGRMVSYFARHEVDKEGEGFSPGEEGFPSAGRIAWALWGGDPGKSWADKEWAKIQARKGTVMLLNKHTGLNNAQVKFVEGGGSFKGYASVFNGLDAYNDTIEKGAYSDLIERMQEGELPMPKMFVNHRSYAIPPGKWIRLEEDDYGLKVEGQFTPGNPEGALVKAGLRHGTLDGLSIGFELGDYEMIEDEEKGYIRVIKNVKALPEISIVTYPADDAARVDLTSVKTSLENLNSMKDLEDFLREAGGFSKALATAVASRAKRISLGDPETKLTDEALPEELSRQIYANLLAAKSL
jgi:HK97 family phage prohead protease